MKFRLPRQLNDPLLAALIKRELNKQKLKLSRLTTAHLAQIAQITAEIEKEGLPAHLVCKKLPQGLGKGIFLSKSAACLPRGQVIAPYAGVLTLAPTTGAEGGLYAFAPLENFFLTRGEQAHFDKGRSFHPRRRYSLFVDAQREGNFTRFVNHSEKPNVEARLVRVGKNPYNLLPCPLEVIYFVKKTIYPGEQLLVSYEGEENCYFAASGIKPLTMTPQTFML